MELQKHLNKNNRLQIVNEIRARRTWNILGTTKKIKLTFFILAVE